MSASRSIQPALGADKRRARNAAKSLAACDRLIKASLNRVRGACGKPSCRCAKNARFRHASLTFTYKHKGRSMGLHVPKSMEQEARQAAADYVRLKKLVQQLSNSNLKKFQRKIAVMKARLRAQRKSRA
jgi:hypothetical protein